MSDTYQATYDAVRSRISGGNVSEAIKDVLRQEFNMANHHMTCVAQEWSSAAQEQARPCVVFKPTLGQDGNQWCALLGDNLMTGIYGFGGSPHLAMTAFDEAWYEKLKEKP